MSSTEKNKEREESGQDMSTEENMLLFSKRGCCCFRIPCFESYDSDHHHQRRSETGGSWWDWEGINRTAENEDKWWIKGWKALKKVREWSEIMAGPKWKTFIRRFNKNSFKNYNKNTTGGGDGVGGGKSGQFQYDPLSYALNFDEGLGGQDSLLDDDFAYRDFSSRYAAIPISAKTSMDLGKDGHRPNFISIK